MYGASQASKRVTIVWCVLKWTYGIVTIAAGLDKFFNLLVSWQIYLNPMVSQTLNISTQYCMYGIGIVEILVGLLILSKFTRYGAYIAGLWLLLIAGNLALLRMYYDVAVRDVVMAVGAFALGILTAEVDSSTRSE